MEKVIDQEFQEDVFESDIDMYLKMFCESNGIDNIKSESQAVWNSCLRDIYKHVFRDTDILKAKDNINNINNNILSNYNRYDYDKVLKVLDIYIFDMCMRYDKEVSIIGFSTMTGIPETIIYDWGRDERKLSSTGSLIYQKLRDFREESLSNKLVTGRQNPVGVLGVLNRHYQWNMPGVSRETNNKKTLTASELPQLGQTQQNTSSLAVLEHGAGETEQNE